METPFLLQIFSPLSSTNSHRCSVVLKVGPTVYGYSYQNSTRQNYESRKPLSLILPANGAKLANLGRCRVLDMLAVDLGLTMPWEEATPIRNLLQLLPEQPLKAAVILQVGLIRPEDIKSFDPLLVERLASCADLKFLQTR